MRQKEVMWFVLKVKKVKLSNRRGNGALVKRWLLWAVLASVYSSWFSSGFLRSSSSFFSLEALDLRGKTRKPPTCNHTALLHTAYLHKAVHLFFQPSKSRLIFPLFIAILFLIISNLIPLLRQLRRRAPRRRSHRHPLFSSPRWRQRLLIFLLLLLFFSSELLLLNLRRRFRWGRLRLRHRSSLFDPRLRRYFRFRRRSSLFTRRRFATPRRRRFEMNVTSSCWR